MFCILTVPANGFFIQSREMPHDPGFEGFAFRAQMNSSIFGKDQIWKSQHHNIEMHQNIKVCGRFRETGCSTKSNVTLEQNYCSLFAWIFRHLSTKFAPSPDPSPLSLLGNFEFVPLPLTQREGVTTRSITVVTSQVLYCFSQVSEYGLSEAALKNDVATVQRLLAAGADPSVTDWVRRIFFMNSLPMETHVAQQFILLAFQVWRD